MGDREKVKTEQIYLNAILGCRRIQNIRLVLPTINDKTIQWKSYIPDWPRAGKRYLTWEEYDYLLQLGMEELPKEKTVRYYQLPKQVYDDLKTTAMKIDSIRFNFLRDYFVIKRILNSSKRKKLRVTLEYRPSETSIDPSLDLNTSNSTLIESLKYQEDIICLVNTEDQSYMDKFRSHLLSLVFNDLKILVNKPIYLQKRAPQKESIKPRGYILQKHLEHFNVIAETTFNNMSLLIDDKRLFEKISLIDEVFEKTKTGANVETPTESKET